MAAGSRIAVEVAGNAASLQEAIDKAAASLRGLADVVAKTSTASLASGDRIIASNLELAKSYASAATAAEASSTRSVSAAKKTEVAFGAAHSSITKLGKDVTLALAGVAAGAVYSGVKFQDATASIAKNAGITTAAANKIGQAFLATAFHSEFSAAQMSAAFGQVAGQLKLTEGHALSASEALKVMKASSDLAEASGVTLATATSTLAGVMQAYHLSVGQAAGATDVLFNVSRSLNVPVESVGSAIGKLHARLGILMPSMSDLSGLMIAIAQTGLPGAGRSIQIVQSSLSTLVGGSKATTDMLHQLGLQTSDLYGPHGFVGMTKAIEELRPKLAGLTSDSQKAALIALFGKTNWELMGQVIEAGVPKFQAATDAANKHGTALTAAQIAAKLLQNEWMTLVHGLEDYAVKISEKVIPALQALIQWVSGAVGWLDKHKTAAKELAGVISGVLGLAVASFAYSKATSFVNGLRDMYNGLKKFADYLAGNSSTIQKGLSDIGGAGTTAGTNVGKGMSTAEGAVSDAEAPLAAGAAKDGTAIAAGFDVAPAIGTKVGAGMAKAEGEMTAAEVPIAADGAAAGAAWSSAFVGAIGPLALAALGGYVAGKAANAILGTNTPSAFNTQGATAAQILAGVASLVPGERLTGSGSSGPTGSSVYGSLQGTNLTSAQKNAMIAALRATGQFPGGKYDPNAPSAAAQGAVALSQKNLAAAVTGASAGFTSQSSFNTNLLKSLGAPVTAGNVAALTAWANAEKPWGSGPDTNNPLDVTIAPGVSTNSAGVKAIPTSAQGLYATEQFILQRTPGILAALRAGTNPAGLSAAVTASGWGTGPFGGGATPGTQPFPTGPGTVSSSTAAAPKPPATSYHYDWRTGKYHLFTAVELKQMQDQWYSNPANQGRPMPTSAAKATATTQAEQAYAITGNTLPGLDTALTRISTAQTKAGDTTLGGLTNAVQTGTLAGLNSQLNYTHTQAMNKLVVGLLEVHTKANEKLALQIDSEYQKALKEQNTLVAAAQLKAAQAALAATITSTAAAFDKRSTDLGKLYAAGTTLGIGGMDAVSGGLAQEVPLTGSLTGSALAPVLAQLIPQLAAGPLSKSQATGYAGLFGANSELGTLFGGLATGGLNATQTASNYDTIYTLIGTLATLQTTVGANTNALADNTATMVSLLQQQNTILSERLGLGAAQTSVLRNFIPSLPHYASGGPVIDDGLIYAHAGEHVVPRGGTLVAQSSPAVHVAVHPHFSGELAPLMKLIDTQVSHPDNVLKISRQIGTRTGQLGGAPGGWR